MVEISDALIDGAAGPIAAALPLIVGRIPETPAAALGRLRAVADGAGPRHRMAPGPRPAAGSHFRVPPGPGGSPALEALGALPPLLVERLLGALELTVPELDPAGVPDMSGLLGEPLNGGFGMGVAEGTSDAVRGAALLEAIRPGAVPLVAALARRLAAHPRVAALLAVDTAITGEREVAAAHGAARLALAVSTAAAVVRRAGVQPSAAGPPAVLGVAIGTAVLLLREAPMPPGYAAAVLAKTRAEYMLPLGASGSAEVEGHRFALLEGDGAPDVDFGDNGLVAVVPGGAVIRTGVERGHVRFTLRVLEEPPPDLATGWEEVVEVSWRAAAGGASVAGASAGGFGPGGPPLRAITPPWPGDYRLRVHARGRDDTTETENYELVVWRAPAAPAIVHARTDRLGHRLRGQPEPVRHEPPEAAYRWLRGSSLEVAATVTVVTGTDVADVLRAFGADPDRPESMRAIDEDLMARRSTDPWVAVLEKGDAVLAVEYNGWQGSTGPVLTRASAGGRAASMYWNVNALTRLSFAEYGEVLLSEEPFGELDAPPRLTEALAGLDFADHHRGKEMMGLVAVGRFTGHGITAEDLARVKDADIGFRIIPHLPPLYPYRARSGAPLGTVIEELHVLPEPALRDLAWWAAAESARYAGLGEDPDVAASVAARALTAGAHLRARRSQLDGGEHSWVWRALHRATNPDPLAAVADGIDSARHAAGPHAANLVADFRTRITALAKP